MNWRVKVNKLPAELKDKIYHHLQRMGGSYKLNINELEILEDIWEEHILPGTKNRGVRVCKTERTNMFKLCTILYKEWKKKRQ